MPAIPCPVIRMPRGSLPEATASDQHHGRRRLGRAQLADMSGEDVRQELSSRLGVRSLVPTLCTQSRPGLQLCCYSSSVVPGKWPAWISHVSIIRCTLAHFIASTAACRLRKQLRMVWSDGFIIAAVRSACSCSSCSFDVGAERVFCHREQLPSCYGPTGRTV